MTSCQGPHLSFWVPATVVAVPTDFPLVLEAHWPRALAGVVGEACLEPPWHPPPALCLATLQLPPPCLAIRT